MSEIGAHGKIVAFVWPNKYLLTNKKVKFNYQFS